MTTPITITKYRLKEIIHAAGLEPCDYEEVFSSIKTGEIVKMARIALAAMDAEPVYQVWDDGKWVDFGERLWREIYDENRKSQFRIVYTAPPASVVPKSISVRQAISALESADAVTTIGQGYKMGWNACRAAMLQGADGTLTNEGTRQTDELVMWIKRLAHSLRKANPDSKLQNDAMEYLSRKDLISVEGVLR